MSYNGKTPAQLVEELDPVLSYVSSRSALPTLSVDINIAGQTVSLAYRDGVGRVPDSDRPLFAVGCVMDMLFAVICLDLHHRTGLSLDEPIATHTPEACPLTGDADTGPITLRHLLTRTSGIQDPRTIDEMRKYVPWDELAPRIRNAPRLFSAGTAFNYGGIDQSILATTLLRVGGKTIAELAEEIITRPCGVFPRPEQYGPMAADGIRRVARCDTSHFAAIAACLAAGSLDGVNMAFSETMRTSLQVEKLQLSRSVRSPPWPHAAAAFTLGLFKYSDGLIGFNGWDTGEGASVRYDPMGQLGFAVALEGSPGVRDYVVAEVAQRLGYHSTQSRAVPCTVGGLNGLKPDDIVGDYTGWAADYRAEVTLDQGAVCCNLHYGSRLFRQIRIELEGGAWLVSKSAAELSSLEFYRDPGTGSVCMSCGGVPYAMTTSNLNPNYARSGLERFTGLAN